MADIDNTNQENTSVVTNNQKTNKEVKTVEEKLLIHARIQTVVMILILIVVVAFVVLAVKTLNHTNAVITQTQTILEQIDVESFNSMTKAMEEVADTLESIDVNSINTTLEGMAGATKSLENLGAGLTGAKVALGGALNNIFNR